jgi:hypothetical protein
MRKIASVGLLAGVLLLCAGMFAAAQKPETVDVTGILVKVSTMGAETTGWELRMPNEVNIGGKMTKVVELDGDVHKFQKLENLRIGVKGTVSYPSASRIVVKVQKIKENM